MIFAQLIGALAALPVAYAMRVSIRDANGHEHFEPTVNAFAPPILVSTNGKPAYG